MPLFRVKKEHFNHYRFGRKDVELRTIAPPWKNSKIGDIATIQSGKDMFKKRIVGIHKGTLARIFIHLDYKRVFPEASTIFEAVRAIKEIYPDKTDFIAFELKDFV